MSTKKTTTPKPPTPSEPTPTAQRNWEDRDSRKIVVRHDEEQLYKLLDQLSRLTAAVEKLTEKPVVPPRDKTEFEKKDDKLVIALTTDRKDTYVSPGNNFAEVRRVLKGDE